MVTKQEEQIYRKVLKIYTMKDIEKYMKDKGIDNMSAEEIYEVLQQVQDSNLSLWENIGNAIYNLQ